MIENQETALKFYLNAEFQIVIFLFLLGQWINDVCIELISAEESDSVCLS